MRKIEYRKARIRPDKNKPKRPHGKPPHAPDETTRNQVKTLAIAGTRQELISKVLKISEPTLRRHYREELDTSLIMANAAVARNLFSKATGNGPTAVTAAIFWLKSQARWTEPDSAAVKIGEIKFQVVKDDFNL